MEGCTEDCTGVCGLGALLVIPGQVETRMRGTVVVGQGAGAWTWVPTHPGTQTFSAHQAREQHSLCPWAGLILLRMGMCESGEGEP